MNKNVLKWTVEITTASVESGKNCHGDEVAGFMHRVFETLSELQAKVDAAQAQQDEQEAQEKKAKKIEKDGEKEKEKKKDDGGKDED